MSRSTDSNAGDGAVDQATYSPGVEPWLKISLAAFVPLALAFYLPDEFQAYLFVAGGLLVLAGIAALIRQEMRGSGDARA